MSKPEHRPKQAAPPKSWRALLPVHPAAEMFPPERRARGISFVLLIASRADDVGQGLNTAFMVLAVLLLATVFVVPMIPEMGQTDERASMERKGEQLELEPVDGA